MVHLEEPRLFAILGEKKTFEEHNRVLRKISGYIPGMEITFDGSSYGLLCYEDPEGTFLNREQVINLIRLQLPRGDNSEIIEVDDF
jgi:hypothetical protein